jgi:uncharacterized protein involved in exopolysaccharide biosynthesis
MNPEQGPQLQDLAGMMRRRRGVAVVVAGGIFLASIFWAAVLPNVYEASTTLLVEPQSVSKRLVEAGLEGSELESRLHLMTMQILSRGRLSRIITDLDLYPEESKSMSREEVISLMRSFIHVEPVVPELAVTTGRDADFEINTFRLFFRSESPTTAAAVANRLANDFIDEHLKGRVQVSGDTSEFIEAELTRLSTRIAELETRIAEVKDANPGRLPEDQQTTHRLLERTLENLRNAERDLAIAESDETFYKQQVLAGGIQTPQQLTPERRLEALELMVSEYRGRGFTEKHPDVVSARLEIAEVETRIAEVKDANPGRLPDDQQTTHRLLERALENLRNAERDLAIAESDEAFYKQQVLAGGAQAPQQLTPERRLEGLELMASEYRSRGFTEKHPDVVSAQLEIAEVKAKIEDARRTGEEAVADAGLSPAQENASAEQQRAHLRAVAARQDVERLNAQIAALNENLAATPRVAEQLSALEREYQHLFGSYQDFSGKRLEAAVAANMERRQKGEQFRILESAFPPPRPTSPNRLLIVVVGLFLGIGCGGALALLLEAVDSSFHGVRQLQTALRFPVLASIPGIVLESDRAAMRRRRIRNAVAAVAVTCVVLAGAVAGNWTVNGVPGFVAKLIPSEQGQAPAPPVEEQG